MRKFLNQCSCTSNKRNVLPHSDHTSYIEFTYFLLNLCKYFLLRCLFFHEYGNSVLLRKDIELNMLYNFKNPFFFLLILCYIM